MASIILYFTPSGTNATRHYWYDSDSIDAFRAWWDSINNAAANSQNAYDDTWGDTSLWQGRRTLSSYHAGYEYYYILYDGDIWATADYGDAPLYTGNAYGCMADFVECDSAGTILGTSIATKLAGKTGLITAASMRLSRYNDGYGTQSVRLRRATIAAIPNQGSHTDTSYSDAGDGLPAQDSMGQNTTKWCFGGDLTSMLNIIQWLMDGKVACLHYGMSEVSHYYGTNGGATKRPMLKVELEYEEPTPSDPALDAISSPITAATVTPGWDLSTDLAEMANDADIYYQLQVSLDGGTTWGGTAPEDGLYITTAALAESQEINLKTFIGLEAAQYYYNAAVMVRIRAVVPYGDPSADYYSDWVESSALTVDYRLGLSAPATLIIKRDGSETNEVWETETADHIKMTAGVPATKNTHDSAGAVMGIDYYGEYGDGTVIDDTVGSGYDAEDATADIPFAVAERTAGADITETFRCKAIDAEDQESLYKVSGNVTLHRFRAPSIVVYAHERPSPGDEITYYIRVIDTGYDPTGQSNAQMDDATALADIGSGYAAVTLGAWDGLKNSFTITGLDADLQYTMNFKMKNAEPATSSLAAGRESSPASRLVLEYTPALAILRDAAASGDQALLLAWMKALIVHSDPDTAVDKGCAVIENNLDVGGEIRQDGLALYVPWAAWVPTITYSGGTTNPSSTTLTFARWMQIGKVAIVMGRFTITRGSGNRTASIISLPFTRAYDDAVACDSIDSFTGSTLNHPSYTAASSGVAFLQVNHGAMTSDGALNFFAVCEVA